MKLNYFLIALSILAFTSCKKEESSSPTGSGKVLADGVMVLNEGQFGANNASINLHGDNGEESIAIFQSLNGNVLGDVLNSVAVSNSNYYLVLNNSGKVEVVGKNDFKSVATITGFSSPRHFLDLGDGRALVTNFVFNSDSNDVASTIDVVDLNQNTIENTLLVSNWCEMMFMKGETIYVANTGKNQLLLIDKNTLSITGTIKTPVQPMSMVEDKNGLIWVLCNGDYVSNPASLISIDPGNNVIVSNFEFSSDFRPQRMALNSGRGTLYFLTDAVYKMSVGSSSLAYSVLLGTVGLSGAYALGVNPDNDQIYVGEAKDYKSKGSINVFDVNGNKVRSFEAGYLPNGFIFQ